VATAFIGIGSNLGMRKKNCEKAIQLVSGENISVLNRSEMLETEPWGIIDQPTFINMIIEVATDLAPEDLLGLLKKIETDLGRTSTVRWGPRVIDLDILFYDDLVMKTAGLEIPHPGIAERYFVLKPLSEIAPEMVHPVLKKSIKDLLSQYRQSF
jgi:2-amino-4-hydroxy-6-hydroxymethyldihydropteridine diphosphokinase